MHLNAGRVNDEAEERDKDENNYCDCVNTADKYGSYARDGRLTSLHTVNKAVADNDLEGEGAEGTRKNIGEDGNVVLWTLPRFNVSGLGLYVPVSPEFLHHFLAPSSPKSHPATPPSSPSDRSVALLREGTAETPVLAATAPSNTRRSIASNCSRPCGGGIRTISQVTCQVVTGTHTSFTGTYYFTVTQLHIASTILSQNIHIFKVKTFSRHISYTNNDAFEHLRI
ncbi:hypothetical protein GWK47_013679 [Chionoecetes opilio]|uniref:Uncharacterized protein n=1 Tax=Chionoecetes opilio TaxID=41210 RepID=A0A8J4Y038_CHIOP|nr:hypothetical protein GWK47_013679 [Chionoecetes opilio]